MGLDSRLRKIERTLGGLRELESLLDQVPDGSTSCGPSSRKSRKKPIRITNPSPWEEALWNEVDARVEARKADPRLADVSLLDPNRDEEVAVARAHKGPG